MTPVTATEVTPPEAQASRIKTELRVIQAVFAVIMALGFRVIVEGTYVYFQPHFGLESAMQTRNSLLYFLPIIAVILLGLRFFWAVVNVRRYIERANARILEEADLTERTKLKHRFELKVVVIHVTFLVAHGFGFYFGCHLVSDLLFATPVDRPAAAFVVFYAAYQYFNAFWLFLLLRDFASVPVEQSRRERFWIWNNSTVSTIAVLIVGIGLFWPFSHAKALMVICAIFILSSVLDLMFTSYHYLESPERSTEPS